MLVKFKKKVNKLYIHLLITIIVCIVTTVLSLSSILYYNFEKIGVDIVQTFTKDSLVQVSRSVDFMNNTARTLAFKIFFDNNFSSIMYNSSPDTIDINNSLLGFTNYRSSTPHLTSISLYNKSSDYLYSTGPFGNNIEYRKFETDKNVKDIIMHPNNKILTPIPRKILTGYSDQKLTPVYNNVYTYLFYDSKKAQSLPSNVLVLNFSESYLREIISSLDKEPDNNIFIIDSNGRNVISNKASDMLINVSSKDYIKKILSSKESFGYFKADIDGGEYLITYVSSTTMDWKFVRLTPYEIIMSKITSMRKITTLISFLILIIGILIYILLSRKLYTPIDRLQNKLNKLEVEKRNSMYSLKQDFLRSIIQDENIMDLSTFLGRFKDYHIHLKFHEPIILVLLKIDHYTELCNQYSSNERNLMRFSISNIVQELSSEYYYSESIDMGEDQVVLLLNCKKHFSFQDPKALKNLLIQIQQSVIDYLKISLSCAVSSIGNSDVSLLHLYSESLEISQYRMFHGFGCILQPSNLPEDVLELPSYSVQKEKQLVEALNAGSSEEARNIYTQIIMHSAHGNYTSFYSTVMHLAFAINIVVSNLKVFMDNMLSYSFNTFLKKLNESETIEEINNYFYELFDFIQEKSREKNSGKHEDLSNRIIEYIRSNYTNPMISVQSIADSVNMSHVYLGRLFKIINGISIPVFIYDLRMQKAEELLVSTSHSVDEIAQQVGYNSGSYFHKVFKKHFAVTPNEFREMKNS